jgi:hypothetical protein
MPCDHMSHGHVTLARCTADLNKAVKLIAAWALGKQPMCGLLIYASSDMTLSKQRSISGSCASTLSGTHQRLAWIGRSNWRQQSWQNNQNHLLCMALLLPRSTCQKPGAGSRAGPTRTEGRYLACRPPAPTTIPRLTPSILFARRRLTCRHRHYHNDTF